MGRRITVFLLSLLLLVFAGCSEDKDEDEDDGDVILTENTWADGSITSSKDDVWYSFSVTKGATYYVWWNDSLDGDGTKTSDIKVSAYPDKESSGYYYYYYFENVNSAWTIPISFRAETDTIWLKVNSSITGTYAIAYSTINTRPSVPNPEGTWVRFVNNNTFPVSIYSDSSREVKMADVEAGGRSAAIKTAPKPGGALFYPIYHFTVYGISFPYEADVMVVRIDADKINEVSVPSLKELADAEPDKQLTTYVYIVIQNNSTTSLTLRQGSNIELKLEGSDSPILNPNENGLYKINPGPVSGYSFMRGSTTPISFPSTLTEFTSATIYSFHYDGTLTLQTQSKLTLGEISNLLTEGTGNSNGTGSGSVIPLTQNIWANGYITSTSIVQYSFNVSSGTRYYVWWNDSYEGNGTKTGDIYVSANLGSRNICRDYDSAWTTPITFIADSSSGSGTVILEVRMNTYSGYSGYEGSFAIAYTTSDNRPSSY